MIRTFLASWKIGLALVFSSPVFAESPPPVELPPLPVYPSPVSQLSENSRGEVYFLSTTPVDFKPFLVSGENNNPTTVKGTLFLPTQAGKHAKVPGIVILHGSGGISDTRELSYGRLLATNNIAALVVDSYGARGVTESLPYNLKVLVLSDADEIADAYAGLRVLATHPAIDKKRIGVMGFSYGGMAVRAALDARIRSVLGKDLPKFAINVDFYGPCFEDFGTTKTTEAPYYCFRGGDDASNKLAECARLENVLRNGHKNGGQSFVYPNAGHGWQLPQEKKFYDTLNPADCRMVLKNDGNWILNDKPFDQPNGSTREQKFVQRQLLLNQLVKDGCIGNGYIIGRDDETRERSDADLMRILHENLKTKDGSRRFLTSNGARRPT